MYEYVYMYRCIYTCKSIYIYIYVCVYIYMYTCEYLICICTYLYIQVYVYIFYICILQSLDFGLALYLCHEKRTLGRNSPKKIASEALVIVIITTSWYLGCISGHDAWFYLTCSLTFNTTPPRRVEKLSGGTHGETTSSTNVFLTKREGNCFKTM